jgi:molybdopterin converting factor small subunit
MLLTKFMTSSEVIDVQLSIHGPIAGRVLRLNTNVQLQNNATFAELLEVVEPQIGVDILTPLREDSYYPVILLNGENLEMPADLEQPLQDGDEVAILQAIAGG